MEPQSVSIQSELISPTSSDSRQSADRTLSHLPAAAVSIPQPTSPATASDPRPQNPPDQPGPPHAPNPASERSLRAGHRDPARSVARDGCSTNATRKASYTMPSWRSTALRVSSSLRVSLLKRGVGGGALDRADGPKAWTRRRQASGVMAALRSDRSPSPLARCAPAAVFG